VTRLSAVWGFISWLAQFVMMSMFVQGFWFGAKLVRDGKVSAGDIVSVSSNLQMCIPQFITLMKGNFAAASPLSLVDASQQTSVSHLN
jgi:ATP-binding cassette subfamily B (MDR/TAP) protein 1